MANILRNIDNGEVGEVFLFFGEVVSLATLRVQREFPKFPKFSRALSKKVPHSLNKDQIGSTFFIHILPFPYTLMRKLGKLGKLGNFLSETNKTVPHFFVKVPQVPHLPLRTYQL